MIKPLPPAAIFILGALLIPLARTKRLKQLILLLVPAVAFLDLLYMSHGIYWIYPFLGYELVLGKVDKLSMCFGYIFVIVAFLGMIYAIHVKEDGQHIATFFHIGSSLGVVFAGDLFTLLIFWEIMAVSGVFLIWYQRDKAALDAGFRYILVHLFGGSCLLAGIIIHVVNRGAIEFGPIEYEGLSSQLILIAFIINAAVPPLHAWLTDAYPEGTVTGSVFLTAFVTKSAVYVLARAFPGVELLMWLGAVMAVYGVVFAVLENDIRRLLAYHIVSQVGYMVCGVGIGGEMAIDGATAHAFCHILYKALLFMGAGAVIYTTGKKKLNQLEGIGLYKKMPITLTLYMIGAFSISGVPFFNGFISKSMVVSAAALKHEPVIELMLYLASIGTFLHTGLKLPYYTFFGRPSEKGEIEAKEPPFNMLLAMGLTSFLCILIGCYPKILYDILPYPVDYHPYTPDHVIGAIQLLLLTGAAFWLYIDKLRGEPTITLDTDWFYRKPAKAFLWLCDIPLNNFRLTVQDFLSKAVGFLTELSKNPYTAPTVLVLSTQISITKALNGLRGQPYPDKVVELKKELKGINGIIYIENRYKNPLALNISLVLIFLLLCTLFV